LLYLVMLQKNSVATFKTGGYFFAVHVTTSQSSQ
jgi:hypothetical protein